MGNRKLPFGYQRCFGDIVPHAAEAEAVRKIYQNYLAGASFRQIAEGLQAQGIPYDGDKQWNKNMVARILENERYTGIGPFPALVPAELFRAVQDRRIQTAPERTQTPAEKELRKLCGGVPPGYVERQVLGILNRLIHDPQLIAYTPKDNSRILSEQRQALNELLRMEELGKQFDKLLGEAANADDAETYMERFQSLSEGMEDLKRRKAGILQIRQEQDAVSRRLQASAAALDAVSAQITEWDENTVYQLLEKVTVMEGFKIRVTFRNGQEIEQSIDQPKRRKRI